MAVTSDHRVYLVWKYQSSGALYLDVWDGSAWQERIMDLRVNTGNNVSDFALRADGMDVYVAWTEGGSYQTRTYRAFMKKNPHTTTTTPTSLNVINSDATAVDIGILEHVPYVAWAEGYHHLYAKYLENGSWQSMGGDIGNGGSRTIGHVSLALQTGYSPHILWDEPNGYASEAACFVKRYNGTVWENVGGAIRGDTNRWANAEIARLGADGTPSIIWSEHGNSIGQSLHFSVYQGDAWRSAEGSLWTGLSDRVDLDSPQLEPAPGGGWYMSWAQGIYYDYYTSSQPVYFHLVQGDESHWQSLGDALITLYGSAYATVVQISVAPDGKLYRLLSYQGLVWVEVYEDPTVWRDLFETLPNQDAIAYPNPGRDHVYFAWPDPNMDRVDIQIYNFTGEVIADIFKLNPGNRLRWDTPDIASGVYLYRIILWKNGEKKCLPFKKLAIQK